jgi:hypothetical protein
MSQDFDSQPSPHQSKNDKPSLSEITTPQLKLVVSNPPPVQELPPPSQSIPSNAGFSSEIRNMGPHIYELNIQDPFHDLGCSLILDLEKSGGKTKAVCHFPDILNESNRFLEEDEDLYGIIMVQFQMKVLEQLFMFCANHNAFQLTIYMDGAQAEGFGIYRDFLNHCHKGLTESSEKTEITLPTDGETFNKWLAFMAEMNFQLEQGLWCEQRSNPAIRHYLKSRPCN